MNEKHPAGKIAVAVAITVALIAGTVAYGAFRTFSSYEVKSEAALSDAGRTVFGEFAGNVVGYSRDGISCLDYDGNLLWTASFEMATPQTVTDRKYMLVYDRGGTEIHVYDKAGKERVISTDLPVERADISESGEAAAIMSDGDTHVVNIYGADGKLLAGGELHTENSGYPIACSVSDDGKKLCVSILDLSMGTIKTTVRFYDFSDWGSKQKDNIAAEFSYSDMAVPFVCFFRDGRAAAFGDDQVMLYSADRKPAETGDIYITDEVKSIAARDDAFALVTGKKADDAAAEADSGETMTVYRETGREMYTKSIDFAYSDISFLSNGELLLTDGRQVELFTDLGVKKFTETFENGLSVLLPWDGAANYIFVTEGKLQKVQLKS